MHAYITHSVVFVHRVVCGGVVIVCVSGGGAFGQPANGAQTSSQGQSGCPYYAVISSRSATRGPALWPAAAAPPGPRRALVEASDSEHRGSISIVTDRRR